MQRKESINIDIHNQKTTDDSKRKRCGFWGTMCIKLWKIIGKNLKAAETESASLILRTNTNAREKQAERRKRPRNFFRFILVPLVHLLQILCTFIFYCNVDIVSLL